VGALQLHDYGWSNKDCGGARKSPLSLPLIKWIESTGWAPLWFVVLFIAGSFLMIWRLECMNKSGVEGTVLGTLVMPYCSGIGNLIFAFVLGAKGGPGSEMLTNALVNNVTNMTLLLGLPAVIWGMSILPQSKAKKSKKAQTVVKINRLSLLLTLSAVLFFTGVVWALAGDGKLDFRDGLVLIGLFLFWQCFHVFEVLKSNVRQNKSLSWMLPVDLALLGVGAYAVYLSTDWLVDWISNIHTGFISAGNLGWLSGWLMVLPNALLAFYYSRRGNPEVVYTSQVGDGHVSIPLSVGIYCLYQPIQVPAFFQTGIKILVIAALIHFAFVAIWGRLPRVAGWVLTAAYVVFLVQGLGK
jgi:cation:H+ antiporter